MDNKSKEKKDCKAKVNISAWAMLIEVLGIGVLFLMFNGLPYPGYFLGMLIAYPAMISPFVGIIMGVVGLFTHRKGGNRWERILSFLAIVFPFACVALVILLAQNGIWIIRFM